MKEIQYKTFSWNTHKKNWCLKRPNVCQFELTFRCGLHCRHCYSDCYNQPAYIKNELDTRSVKSIIDKMYSLGIIWFCFTGGDPLERKDFLELYSYAKEKGFLITIFTTAYSLTQEIADYLAEKPPFVIEITINGVTQDTYEKITQVKSSYRKSMMGLEMMLRRKLPLKVKTMATQQNLKELPQIKEFLENKGLRFRVSSLLYARLNGDIAPCALRLTPQQIIALDKFFNRKSMEEDEEGAQLPSEHRRLKRNGGKLFRCAAGSIDGINIDPYGKMFFCSCIREPAIDFWEAPREEIEQAIFDTFPKIAASDFKTDSKCRNCDMIELCCLCPGKAYLEGGDMEAPLEYYCELTHARREALVNNRQLIT